MSKLLISFFLTHWGLNKMAAILQTTFSNAFSYMIQISLKFVAEGQINNNQVTLTWSDAGRVQWCHIGSLGHDELSAGLVVHPQGWELVINMPTDVLVLKTLRLSASMFYILGHQVLSIRTIWPAFCNFIPWICYEGSFSEFYLFIWNQLVFNQRLQLFVQSPQPSLLIFTWRN